MQGFSFCPETYQPRTGVYSGFYSIHEIIPPQRQNRLQSFTGAFPLICPIPAHTIQQSHNPPMHRLCHAGRCTGRRSRPIIIRYIRVRPFYGIHARQCSMAHSTRRGSPVAEGGGRRGTIGGLRRISFRAFARWPIEVSNSRSVPVGIVVASPGE